VVEAVLLPEPYVFRAEYVTVTPEYSNAVLQAVIPFFTTFINRSELPIATPLTPAQIHTFGCDAHRGEVGGTLITSNGYKLECAQGHVRSFESPHKYFGLQNPDDIPKYFGPIRLTEREALARVRQFVLRLGYSLEETFVAWPPAETHRSGPFGTNTIPYIEFTWEHPILKIEAATFEVNLETGQVEGMSLVNPNLYRPAPKINVEPEPGRVMGGPTALRLSREYAAAVLPNIFREARDRAILTGMSPPSAWAITDVTEWHGEGTNQWVWLSARLKGGWTVHWKGGVIAGVTAPGAFFSNVGSVRVEDYAGRWRVSERKAIKAARAALLRAGYPAAMLGLEKRPTVVRRPYFTGAAPIPRLMIQWEVLVKGKPHESTAATVEYDMDAGKVMSFRISAAKLSAPLPNVGIPMH
jgi:hypothetical protein